MDLDQVRAIVRRFEAPPDSRVLVAEMEDGEVVATCTLTRLEHRMCRHRADIGGFVIGEEWRGTGLARQLVAAAADFARREWSTSILEIAVRGDTHGHQAYLGLGFVEWGRLPGGYEDNGVALDEVRLYQQI
jgi:predicted GNAT family N-acyltransferase